MTQNYRWIGLLGLVITVCVHADSVDKPVKLARVQQAQVYKYSTALRRELGIHKKARIGLQAAGMTMIMYQTYAMAKAFGLVGKSKEGNKQVHAASHAVAPTEDDKGFLAATKDFLTSRQTYYILAASGFELGSMVVFQKALEELQKRVFESDTIAWLTTLRAPIRVTIAELHAWERCMAFEYECRVDPKRAAYVRASFISTMETLAHTTEMIVGYMQYKASQLSTKHKEQAGTVARELLAGVNKKITDIERVLSVQQECENEVDYAVELLSDITELEQKIERECMHFARLEGSYWHAAQMQDA